jgi:hypothetical protein
MGVGDFTVEEDSAVEVFTPRARSVAAEGFRVVVRSAEVVEATLLMAVGKASIAIAAALTLGAVIRLLWLPRRLRLGRKAQLGMGLPGLRLGLELKLRVAVLGLGMGLSLLLLLLQPLVLRSLCLLLPVLLPSRIRLPWLREQ